METKRGQIVGGHWKRGKNRRKSKNARSQWKPNEGDINRDSSEKQEKDFNNRFSDLLIKTVRDIVRGYMRYGSRKGAYFACFSLTVASGNNHTRTITHFKMKMNTDQECERCSKEGRKEKEQKKQRGARHMCTDT